MTTTWPEGSPQADALGNPDQPYTDDGKWTPNSARAWWDKWFAAPYPLSNIPPADLPGSLVLTDEEVKKAQAINDDFARQANAALAPMVAPAKDTKATLRKYIATYEAIPVEKRTPRQLRALATDLESLAKALGG